MRPRRAVRRAPAAVRFAAVRNGERVCAVVRIDRALSQRHRRYTMCGETWARAGLTHTLFHPTVTNACEMCTVEVRR
jgi:hypothetical protein